MYEKLYRINCSLNTVADIVNVTTYNYDVLQCTKKTGSDTVKSIRYISSLEGSCCRIESYMINPSLDTYLIGRADAFDEKPEIEIYTLDENKRNQYLSSIKGKFIDILMDQMNQCKAALRILQK